MKLQKGLGKDLDFMDQPDDDQAALSSLLEESVESLSATVGGWRAELARSSERSARLEATIASHTDAMETWKADLASTGAKAEEKLLRALEILETRMSQNQAIASEIRDSMGSSASLLTRALEEWKAEIRYGSGLTEVRVLSAIESIGGQIGQVKGSLEEWSSGVGESQKKTESRLLKSLEALNESISTLSTAVVKSRDGVEGLVLKLNESVQDWRGQAGSAAVGTEKKLLLSLEALETGIAHSLNTRQKIEKRLLIMLEELEMRLSRSQQEGEERQQRLESTVMALANSIEGWRSNVPEAGDIAAARHEIENRLLMSLGELEMRLSRSHQEGGERQERLESSVMALAESIDDWRTNIPEPADNATAREEIDNRVLMRLEGLDMRLSRSESSMMTLAQTIDEWRSKGRESAGKTKERISLSLEALENRILENRQEAAETRDKQRKELASLVHAVDNLRSKDRDYARVMRALEELDQGLLRNRDDVAGLADIFEARLGELERRILERNNALVTLMLGQKADPGSLAKLEEPAPGGKGHDAAQTFFETRNTQQVRRRRG
jgi:hemoglobin-like flavoprotein